MNDHLQTLTHTIFPSLMTSLCIGLGEPKLLMDKECANFPLS